MAIEPHGQAGILVSGKILDVARRRVAPFLKQIPPRQTLTDLLAEAYVQGLTDAIDTIGERHVGLNS